MAQKTAIVVGAGVFGCVIAATLRDLGISVQVFDDRRPMDGSTPSGFLMKPSWITMMPKEDLEDGFALLDRLYGITDIQLKMWPLKKMVTAHHLSRQAVLYPPNMVFRRKSVIGINFQDHTVVVAHNPVEEYADYIVIAAGVWTNDIFGLEIPGLYGKRGISFIYKGVIKPFIKPWAPYKQVVAHQHDKPGEFWVGDGTAIKTENWTIQRQRQTQNRVMRAIGPRYDSPVIQHGIRSFVKDSKPCYFKKIARRTWTVAGGGKNGTIAAAWAANRLAREL